MSSFKNYYDILEVPQNASSFEIEQAYQKLATYWHPDKHKQNRKQAEMKFHDINEAYDVLSNRSRRSHYDDLLVKQYSAEDANRTFEKFFDENGMEDETEKKFFEQHYPNKTKTYYDVLEISKNASLDQIKQAYRRLALKYHPKNNPNNEEAARKFVEVNEAYNALSTQLKRKNYDDIVFGQIAPTRAYDIFEDFVGDRFYQLSRFPEEDEFFKPIIKKKWSRNLNSMMDDENWKEVDNGQSYKSSTVYSNKNGVESKKTVTTKRKVDKGVSTLTTTEEYEYPDGTKQVRQILDDGKGTVTNNVYHLKKGEKLPIAN